MSDACRFAEFESTTSFYNADFILKSILLQILCIDEATSNIDQETDRLIQETIRCIFRRSTVVTIAHRISTILDSDRVIMMQEGEILEFDKPEKLLSDPNSNFYRLVHNHDNAGEF
jgi:ATP-binding cassette, subfamily C (CFTR/MRP), member 10